MPLDEFSFKEMRTWDQSKISSCCLCVWCNSRALIGRGSPRSPAPIFFIIQVIFFIPNNNGGKLLHRPSTTYKSYWAESHLHGGNISPACFHGYLAITGDWPVYLVDKLSWVSYKGLFDRVAYGILSNINGGGATPRRYVECLWMIGLMVVMLMVFFQVWWVGVGVSSLGNWSYSKECVWNLRTKLCCNVPGKWNVVQIAHG